MDKEIILDNLKDIRDIRFACWNSYKQDAIENPQSGWRRDLAESADMNVRVLDYVMEAIRKNDIV